MGLRPADSDFVDFIREWTTQDNALLVLDEVITFRSTYSGAQGWYNITPDLTAMGKMIGGGFPVGAIAFVILGMALPSRSDRRRQSIDYAGAALLATAIVGMAMFTARAFCLTSW